MAVERGLFVPQTGATPNVQGTNPIQARLALAGLLAENASGTPRTGLLQPSTPLVVTGTADMSYNVAPINPVTNRAAAAGVYVYSTTGTTNVKTTAAPGANSRYDIIWTKQNDTQYGDSDTLAVVKVTQGTPSATPVKPSLPPEASGAIILAEALIQSGATATNSSAVQITQVWRYTVPRGVPIPVRNDAEKSEITAKIGDEVRRVDLPKAPIEYWSGSSWVGAGGRQEFTSTTSGAPSNRDWGTASMTLDPSRSDTWLYLQPGQPDFLNVLVGGDYSVSWVIIPTRGHGQNPTTADIRRNESKGEVLASTNSVSGGTWELTASNTSVRLAAGERLKFSFKQQSGGTMDATHRISIKKQAG